MSNPPTARVFSVVSLDTLVDTLLSSEFRPSGDFLDRLNDFEADTDAVFLHLPLPTNDPDTVYFGLRDGSHPDLESTGDVGAFLRIGQDYHLVRSKCKFVFGDGRAHQELFDQVELAVEELSIQLEDKVSSEEVQLLRNRLASLATVITASLCAHHLDKHQASYSPSQVSEMVEVTNYTLDSLQSFLALGSDV